MLVNPSCTITRNLAFHEEAWTQYILRLGNGKRQAASGEIDILPHTSFLQHSTSRLSASDAGDRDHSLKVLQYDSVGVSGTAAEPSYDGQTPVRSLRSQQHMHCAQCLDRLLLHASSIQERVLDPDEYIELDSRDRYGTSEMAQFGSSHAFAKSKKNHKNAMLEGSPAL